MIIRILRIIIYLIAFSTMSLGIINAEGMDAAGWYEKGYRLSMDKQFNNALTAFSRAIEINPNYFEAYVERGIVYSDLGQYDLAVKDLSKSISINPHKLGYFNRGVAYKRMKLFDEAQQDFTMCINMDSNFMEAYLERGVIYANKKVYPQAIEDFTKVAQLKPDFAPAYYRLGYLHLYSNNYVDCIYNLQKFLEYASPSDSRVPQVKAFLREVANAMNNKK